MRNSSLYPLDVARYVAVAYQSTVNYDVCFSLQFEALGIVVLNNSRSRDTDDVDMGLYFASESTIFIHIGCSDV